MRVYAACVTCVHKCVIYTHSTLKAPNMSWKLFYFTESENNWKKWDRAGCWGRGELLLQHAGLHPLPKLGKAARGDEPSTVFAKGGQVHFWRYVERTKARLRPSARWMKETNKRKLLWVKEKSIWVELMLLWSAEPARPWGKWEANNGKLAALS